MYINLSTCVEEFGSFFYFCNYCRCLYKQKSEDMSGNLYEQPTPVWKLIKEHVPEFEQDEVKSILGESLVEQSMDLHNEVLQFILLFNLKIVEINFYYIICSSFQLITLVISNINN